MSASTSSPAAYRAALDALFARTGGHIKPGLSRTEALLASIGNPHRQFPALHVAGTNGKGSTCATLDALLRAQGLRVGRYTSPHLVDFRERVLVNGVPIAAEGVLAFLERIQPESDRLGATFFEITTALAFAYFAELGVDVAVVETGLGGRFDSTNVILPVAATVTNVSLDHAEFLGDTIPQIAREKAGIFKSGRPAVIGEPGPEVATFLADHAAEQGAAPIVMVREGWTPTRVVMGAEGTQVTANTPCGPITFTTPLFGVHQAQNTLTALATLHAASEATGGRYGYPPSPEALDRALAGVHLPGRFQRAGDWIFDVAHNPAGAQVLAETLRTVLRDSTAVSSSPVTALLGVLADKDWRGMLDTLLPVVDTLIITQPASAPPSRAWDPAAAARYAEGVARGMGGAEKTIILEPVFDNALHQIGQMSGVKLVTGSFHTVGDALERLGLDPLVPARLHTITNP